MGNEAKVDEEALELDGIGFQEVLKYLSHRGMDYVVRWNTCLNGIQKLSVSSSRKKYGVNYWEY